MKYGFKVKNIKGGQPLPGDMQIVDSTIHVGQTFRGGQSIQKWIEAVKAAERLITPSRKALYDLYKDITIDGFLTAIIDKRERAVKTAEGSWGEDIPDGVKDKMSEKWFYDQRGQIATSINHGYTVIETMVQGGEITGSKIVPRQNVKGEKALISYDMYTDDGIFYQQGKYPKYIFEVGTPEDLGLLSRLAPYVLIKRDNLVFWSYFNQFFGMPLRVYTYQQGNTQQRQEIEKNAKALSAAGYIILPHGAGMELKDSNKSGAVATYGELHKMMNEEMAITELGQALTTTNSDKGSYAIGRVHEGVEEAVNLQDLMMSEYIINYQCKRIYREHGIPLRDEDLFRYKRLEKLNTAQKMDMAVKAHSMGVRFSEEYFWQEFGWDKSHIEISTEPEPAPPSPPTVEEEPVQEEAAVKKKAQLKAVNSRLQLLYKNTPHSPLAQSSQEHIPPRGGNAKQGGVDLPQLSLTFNKDLQAAWDKAIADLHAGNLAAGTIPGELWLLIGDELYKAVEQGYGKSLGQLGEQEPDADMLRALRTNIYVFSKAKTYQQLEAARDMLLDESGVLRSFDDFKTSVLQVYNDYNVKYLYTEYQMAVGNSQMASKWLEIQSNKDVLPMLRFRAVKDERTRHMGYDGITLPVDHPAWDYLTPLLDYGCRCTLQQVAEGEATDGGAIPGRDLIKKEFQFNPGKDKVIFPKSHPYYDIAEADRERYDQQPSTPDQA